MINPSVNTALHKIAESFYESVRNEAQPVLESTRDVAKGVFSPSTLRAMGRELGENVSGMLGYDTAAYLGRGATRYAKDTYNAAKPYAQKAYNKLGEHFYDAGKRARRWLINSPSLGLRMLGQFDMGLNREYMPTNNPARRQLTPAWRAGEWVATQTIPAAQRDVAAVVKYTNPATWVDAFNKNIGRAQQAASTFKNKLMTGNWHQIFDGLGELGQYQ